MIFVGTFFIVMGVFFLLRNLGIISGELWDVFWPSVLIILGIKLILGSGKWRKRWRQPSDGKKITIE